MASDSALTEVGRNTDFAAELVINRIMNGQLETKDGKTINAAGRLMATRHDATAYTYGALAENVAYGKTIVEGTENALTELKSQIEHIRDIFSADDLQNTQDLAESLLDNLDAILATEINGVKVLDNTGFDVTLSIDGNETIKIGQGDARGGTYFGTLYNELDALKTNTPIAPSTSLPTQSDIVNHCNDALTELIAKIGTEGQNWGILDNRYVMYNDLASTYHTASDDQVVHMGGSMSILDSFS